MLTMLSFSDREMVLFLSVFFSQSGKSRASGIALPRLKLGKKFSTISRGKEKLCNHIWIKRSSWSSVVVLMCVSWLVSRNNSIIASLTRGKFTNCNFSKKRYNCVFHLQNNSVPNITQWINIFQFRRFCLASNYHLAQFSIMIGKLVLAGLL